MGSAQISISIKILPPEPFIERPPPPTANHVWIEGEWVARGGQYVQQPGYWTVPEKDHIWVKGEWVRNPDGSAYWQAGYWKPIPHVGVAMWIPEPHYLRPPRPGNNTVWVHGEWYWVMGYWKRIPDNVFVMQIPPEPAFSRPPAPSPEHIWVDGEWV